MKESITYPLNATQWDTYGDTLQSTQLTQFNTTVCMPFERSSAQRFLRAMQQMLDEHRYLHIHLVRQGDDIMVCEDWEMPNNVHYYRMSDAEWEATEPTFTKAFDIFNEACVHLSLIETDTECSGALYTQALIDELSQITGELALRLVGDQDEKLSSITI